MVKIHQGDIFEEPVDIIIHQCNCFNTMGAGIAKEIKRLYPRAYKVDQMTKKGDKKKLGQFTVAQPDEKQNKYIINLYGQYKYGKDKQHTDYEAVSKGLSDIHIWLSKMDLIDKAIGIPYGMGCGMGGGSWKIVEDLIQKVFGSCSHQVLICKK